MSLPTDKELLRELVAASKKYSSTEEFLLYIAAEDGILKLCQKLIDGEDQNGELQLSLTEICGEYSVNLDNLLKKIREVVRALSPNGHEITNAYSSLGLEDTATLEEVKKAFRKLSLQYHPDHSKRDADTEKFLKIRGAYQSIIDEKASSSIQQATAWKQPDSRKRSRQNERNKKFVYTIVALITLLLLATLFLTNKQKQRALKQRSEAFASRQEKNLENKALSTASEIDKSKQNKKVSTKIPDVTFQELEVSIPPDPLLLATLENPFPFRTTQATSITKEEKIVKKPSALSNTAAKKSDQDAREQGALLEEKIKLLEQRIQEMEQKTVDTVEVQPESLANPAFSTKPAPSEAYKKTAQIREFLDLYAKTYAGRDVDEHMRLFMPDALENDTPVSAIVDTYENLFDKTSSIRMKIFNFQWKEYLNDLQVHGYFDAEYTYKTGSIKNYFGEITFHLTPLGSNEIKIKKFTYTLN